MDKYKTLSSLLELPNTNQEGEFLYGKWRENLKYLSNIYQSYGLEDAKNDEFYRGKVAMKVMYNSGLTMFQNHKLWDSTYREFDMEIKPLPYYPDKPKMAYIRVNSHMAIPAASQSKDLAWKVIEFIMSKDAALQGAKKGMPFRGEFVTYLDKDILNVYRQRYKNINVNAFYFGEEGPIIYNDTSYRTYEKFERAKHNYFYKLLDGQVTLEEEQINKQGKE